MKAKKSVTKKKGIALPDADHGRYDPARVPDLRIPDRIKALNKIIDTIESRGIVSSSDIRMLASDKLTTMVRSDRFIMKLCKMIVRATNREYFEDDDTQAKVEDFAYEAIRELAWRTADSIGLERTKEIVESALEVVEFEFK